MAKYRYALVNRPAGIGCIPRDIQYEVMPRPERGQPHHELARHGILVSPRELTVDELRSFELAPLVDGEQLNELAKRVAAGRMGEYATEYVQAHADDHRMFRDGALTAVRRVEPGVLFSIGDDQVFVELVLQALRERAGRPAPKAE